MAMAVSSGGGGGGRRRGRRRGGGSKPMSEINVTPMVDVMLVLLIIFMVAAPLMTVGVPIELPQTQAKQLNTEQKPITISVTNEGAIFLGDNPVTLDDLVTQVAAVAVNGTEDRIYVRGDLAANYGSVMQVMGALSGAGYAKIGLITEQAAQQQGQ
ncbi:MULTISPECIES: protein TolR [unclassified Devosia]|jgi:biopolymer transport protein TolR|uniref:protein TolR n=1 Tax=unclassified Devosia TaxID=196773 RepID=UPI00086CAF21|nr:MULTISPECIES: protein TolR [unclassified Devosia]MBN9363515.1 protein TolR [Devosia sp.]ODS95330.1 MAG: protein TolR [Devosia sp. SCN 66-27]OJX25326.1 MAG: protein TolR [Devosia sp. 66-14]